MFADCDIHNDLTSTAPLVPYLPGHWVEHFHQSEFKGPSDTYYPPIQFLDSDHVAARTGQDRADHEETTSRRVRALEPTAMRAYLDHTGVHVALLNCCYAIDSLKNPDPAVALARPVNDWQMGEWLETDNRFRASIVVPIQIPQLAIEEIERVGDHRGFVV